MLVKYISSPTSPSLPRPSSSPRVTGTGDRGTKQYRYTIHLIQMCIKRAVNTNYTKTQPLHTVRIQPTNPYIIVELVQRKSIRKYTRACRTRASTIGNHRCPPYACARWPPPGRGETLPSFPAGRVNINSTLSVGGAVFG